MKKMRGFTLIELLIVVAIIAILAAIAVPNFLEAQVRAKVSRVKTDMRSIATAIESYMIDNNDYAASARHEAVGNEQTVHSVFANATPAPDPLEDHAAGRVTFRIYMPDDAGHAGHSLTTPVSYMSNLPKDVFADTRGATFGYWNAQGRGYMMWSYGPDADESDGNGQIQSSFLEGTDPYDWATNSVYNPLKGGAGDDLWTGPDGDESYTYDSTNGTTSTGDVWRVQGE